MSELSLQEQIDTLKKMFADQQDENERLRKENIQLKAKLRAAKSVGNLGSTLFTEIEQLALEVEQYKDDAERIASALLNAYTAAQNAYDKARNDAQAWIDTLEEMLTEAPVPLIVLAMQETVEKLLSAKAEGYTDGLNQIVERTGKTWGEVWDAYKHPDVIAKTIYTLCSMTATLQIAAVAAKNGLAYSKNPNMVAYDIISECIANGKPDIKTVSRLPMDWIDNNLPEPPAKYDTLLIGLEAVQTFKNSGQNRRSYVTEYRVTESALRRNEGWYKALEERAVSPQSVIGKQIK